MARTSRWDRPPAPKDVRWFVRLVGKILIGTGLLMFGFVAYQLWGTGIEYARAQDDLSDQFEELLAGTSTTSAPTTSVAPSTTAAPTTTVGPITTIAAATTVAGSTSVVATSSSSTSTSTSTSTTVAPTTTLAPTTTVEPPLLDFSYANDDVGLAQLWIPSIGIEAMNVVQGVGRNDLQRGPGHYPSTAFPGELGNAAVAGHRTTYGGPFEALPDVEVGDEIAFVTANGTFTYRVTGTTVVNPEDGWVVQTTDPTKATLTLTTCTPKGTAKQRFVVFAELVPELSAQVGRYVPRGTDGTATLPGGDYEGTEPAATSTAPATTMTSTSTTVAPTTTVDPVATSEPAANAGSPVHTDPASSAPSTTLAATTTTDDPVVSVYSVGIEASAPANPDDADNAADEEAFGSHWFDDRAAIPQVLLWGAITTAIVVVAYQVAKHFRNSWIGLVVGVVPFLVTLYFFYQNVNRLLPAAL